MSTGFIDAKAADSRPRSSAAERPLFTPKLIGFMASLCLAALAIAAFGRLTGIGVQQLSRAPVTEARELLFLDAGRGVVEIRDPADGRLVQTLRSGEGGFIRTVMRGFAHDRMARGGDSATPFRLTLHADGYLLMRDPMTGREVILDSFGKPNRDVFAALLAGAATSPSTTSAAAGAAQTQGERK